MIEQFCTQSNIYVDIWASSIYQGFNVILLRISYTGWWFLRMWKRFSLGTSGGLHLESEKCFATFVWYLWIWKYTFGDTLKLYVWGAASLLSRQWFRNEVCAKPNLVDDTRWSTTGRSCRHAERKLREMHVCFNWELLKCPTNFSPKWKPQKNKWPEITSTASLVCCYELKS